jgi:hypothetical protein
MSSGATFVARGGVNEGKIPRAVLFYARDIGASLCGDRLQLRGGSNSEMELRSKPWPPERKDHPQIARRRAARAHFRRGGFRKRALLFLSAISFSALQTADTLRDGPDSANASPQMALQRATHLASLWLDLAEDRLRLDRLRRNAVGKTFFPWAYAHSSRDKKVLPLASSADAPARRRVRRRSSFGSPIAIEAAMVAGSKT